MKARKTRLSIDSLEDRVTPATAADLNTFALATQRTAFTLQALSKNPGMIASPIFRPMVEAYFKGVFAEAQETLVLLNEFPDTFSAGISEAIGEWATVNENIAQMVGNALGFSVVPPTVTPPNVVGVASAADSTVAASPASIAVNGTSTVTLTARDANGDLITKGGATVTFSLGAGTGQGTFGTVTDHANGTYSAIFTGTTAGTNTIKATINGKTLTTTAPTITIVGPADATKSTVSASPSSLIVGGTSTITLTAKDANGNSLTTGGATVLFALGAGTGTGTFGTVTDHANGTYTATFTATGVGTNSVTATFNGSAVTSSPSIIITAPTADPTKSTVAIAPASVATGGTSTVTLTAKDANGNPITTGGATVLFSLGSGTGSGTFGTVTDHANGTYTATFTATTAGTNTIKATLNSANVTTTAPTVTVVGPPDLTTSTVSASPTSLLVGGTTAVKLTMKDTAGNQEPTGGGTVLFSLGAGTATGTFGTVTDNGDGTYSATFNATGAGTNTIKATFNGSSVTSTAPTITVTVPTADPTKSTVAIAPATLSINGTSTVTLTAKDASGNPITTGGATVLFSMGIGAGQGTFGTVTDHNDGTYTATFTATTAGDNTIKATLNGTTVSTVAPNVAIVGPTDPAQSLVTLAPTSINTGATSTVTVTAKDANGHQELAGGSTVLLSLGAGTADGTFSAVTDNGDGTYTATFTGMADGTNTITATIDGVALTSTAPTITVGSPTADPAQSLVSIDTPTIQSTGTATVTLTAKDSSGTQLTSGGSTVVFSLGAGTGSGTFDTVTDNGDGTYDVVFTGTTAGTNTITATIDGVQVTSTAPTITVVGAADPLKSLVSLAPTSIANGSTSTVTLTAKDANNVQEPAGGSTVVFSITGAGTGNGTFGTVTDNGDGTYSAIFTANTAGTADITATIGGTALTSTAPTLTIT
ncbi:MAG TPA: invasin domain 3-containing protein [Gemmataceae bacterium]|jgi:adhesin/invasin|nr:invasin domain 3-containing protein [Gemmataceae bacterium]